MGHYGWHSFNLHVLPGFASTSSSVLSHHAHNLFLEVAAELGIVGLILLVVLLASWLRQFFLNWLVPANWLVASVLLVLFIHSNLEYPSWYSYFLGTFLIFLALGDNRMTHATFSPRLGQISTAISLFLAGAILTATFSGYQVLKNIYHPSDETGISVTAERVKHVSLNPLLTPWAEITMVTTGKSNQGRIKEQLAVVSRATRFQPNPVKVRLQIIYFALADQPEDAIAWLRRFSKAYAPLLPAFICTMKESPHEKVRLLAHEGETILRRTLSCLEEEKRLHTNRVRRPSVWRDRTSQSPSRPSVTAPRSAEQAATALRSSRARFRRARNARPQWLYAFARLGYRGLRALASLSLARSDGTFLCSLIPLELRLVMGR